jgi:hypothetical protein
MKRILIRAALLLVALLGLIQVAPYGHAHSNPPVTAEPNWESPATRDLARRACFDCHSNETGWPWYSWVAPVSWLVQNDVSRGRRHLNFSEWDKKQRHAGDAAEMIEKGEMPPWYYLPMHPDAKLTADEKAELVKGFDAMFPSEEEGRGRGRGGDDEEGD